MGALETHREYIQLCIQHPELGCSILMLQDLGRDSFANILTDGRSVESERALWFASYVLHTMEQLFEATQGRFRRDAHWRATIWSQLDYHRGLLEEVWPQWRRHYGTRFGKMIDKLLDSPPDEPEPGT
ncbi:hypothetical protein MZO42_10340 [Sphingomonas psychrotolerans]|uniref:Uncharacterized protein n=1 Tax=Sphingomonas psychrotolerans TaxID=1327635 RepID=A0ABU3N3Q8_9SPHN|nr:hypothetical protein [Sphingomonas psychrotolerans]MDT8759097.1 hypothetical protein [Sphingomonas psychrotolerans]